MIRLFLKPGLLDVADWKAQWIEPVRDTLQYIPAPFLRKEIALDKKITSARASSACVSAPVYRGIKLLFQDRV